METSETYDMEILRDVRHAIIAKLEKQQFFMEKTYVLSDCEEDCLEFELLILNGIPEIQRQETMEHIHSYLKEVGFEISEYHSTQYRMTVDITKPYRNKIKVQSYSAQASKNGRPLATDVYALRTKVQTFIEENTPIRFSGVNLSVALSIRVINDANPYVQIQCNDQSYLDAIARVLERNENYFYHLKTMGNLVYVYLHEIDVPIQEIECVKILFKRIESELREHHLTPSVASSAFRACAKDGTHISCTIQCKNPAEVETVFSFLREEWDPEKQGMAITLSLDRATAVERALDESRVTKNLISGGMVPHKYDEPVSYGYTHTSWDYHDFHFLPFNRDIDEKHVDELIELVEKWGLLGFVVVAETTCIDGKLRKWIVDGQHRFCGFKKKKMPVMYIKVHVNTKQEIVELIAALNAASKSWKLYDYLVAWSSLDIDDYILVLNKVKSTKIPITILLEIFSGKNRHDASALLRQGKFTIDDKETAENYVLYLQSLKSLLPSKSRDLLSACVTVFREYGMEYDNDHMVTTLTAIKENKLTGPVFNPDEIHEELVKKLKVIYTMSEVV